jgi:hypothetical protein
MIFDDIAAAKDEEKRTQRNHPTSRVDQSEIVSMDHDYTVDLDDSNNERLASSYRCDDHGRHGSRIRLLVCCLAVVSSAALGTWIAIIFRMADVWSFRRSCVCDHEKTHWDRFSAASESTPTAGEGDLQVPGYKLAYNTSYCRGVEDPDGAHARGCRLDPVHGGWIPILCSDEELYRDFTSKFDWKWYSDENRTTSISQAAVWQGQAGRRTYTVDDYHYRHCEYILKTLIRSHVSQTTADGYKVLDFPHLEHCLDRLINYNTPEIRKSFTEAVEWTSSAKCYVKI